MGEIVTDTASQDYWLASGISSKNNWEAELAELHFKSAPNGVEMYNVGDHVEVLCDHDRNGNRIRDWLVGTVVQVDLKMIAIQFQENVYLTDGWMVPDHVLWCPKNSNNIRIARRRKRPRQRVR